MFAGKNMDVNSTLLKLKLDMVYRNLSTEEAQKLYSELTASKPAAEPAEAAVAPPPEQPKPKPKTVVKRKVVKGLVPPPK